jgi:hypothetical protein
MSLPETRYMPYEFLPSPPSLPVPPAEPGEPFAPAEEIMFNTSSELILRLEESVT